MVHTHIHNVNYAGLTYSCEKITRINISFILQPAQICSKVKSENVHICTCTHYTLKYFTVHWLLIIVCFSTNMLWINVMF